MAESSNLFETLKCIICLDFAEEAVETSCCHQVCCNDCGQPQKKCPTCERIEFQLQPNIAIRRMIASLPADCPYEKCGTKTTKGELKAHLESCPVKNQVPCPDKECDFADKAEVVAKHFVEQHSETNVDYIAQTLNTEKAVRYVKCFFPSCNVRFSTNQIWSHVQDIHHGDLKVFQDVSSLCIVSTKEPVKMKNGLGHPVKMGHNGKFYCDRENAVEELVQCIHPNDNCCACMKLDLMYRDLGAFRLVNREGRICKSDPCNHLCGAYFSGQPKMVARLCQKKVCGNNAVFYCERSREHTTNEARYNPCGCGSGRNSYQNTYNTVVYCCRPHGENRELCPACKNITDLMADPHHVYNTVWTPRINETSSKRLAQVLHSDNAYFNCARCMNFST